MAKNSFFVFVFLVSCAGGNPYRETVEKKYKACYHHNKALVDQIAERCAKDGNDERDCKESALKWVCGN